METEALGAAGEIDFSMLALFFRSTWTVKLVMITLVIASFWSWSIIVQKFINYRKARREAALFEEVFWSGDPLDTLYERLDEKPGSALEKIFSAGMAEWRRSHRSDGGLIAGAQARIDRAMNVALGRAADDLNKGLILLATVGSIAPFVGLFGTVWGIMNAFKEIANQQSTNLAVVAPGIAEALLATALGLLAAIPAVVFYNKLSGDADRLTAENEVFADEFSLILSRQLDQDE
ncbi:MAG: protein TolQ [Rhodobacteraceae bacterium]|nr:protein TolQ [Paracoccaceae bacterium]